MANIPQLNSGCLQVIMSGGEVPNPLVQILGYKRLHSSSSENERYRVLLSDGQFKLSFAMYATKSDVSGILETNSIVRLKRYATNVIKSADKGDARILIIMDLELVMSASCVGGLIGSPVSIEEDSNTSKSQAPPSTTTAVSNSAPAVIGNHQSSNLLGAATHNSSSSMRATPPTLNTSMINTISCISPYFNQWVIRVRCVNKSAIRTWSNSRGEGKLFSADLLDESGEIRCTAFRDTADKYYELLQVDKVYYLSKCQVKPANRQFNTLKNDYELVMTSETILEECPLDGTDNDASAVPQVKYDFVAIDKLAMMEVGTLADVIGVCKTVGECQQFVAKSGRELKKREIALVDQSNHQITFTMWNAEAETFDVTPAIANSNNPVVLVKSAKICEFNGSKTISSVFGTQLKLNPDIAECYRLKGWYDSEGANSTVYTNVSAAKMGGGASGQFSTPWMTFKEVRESGLGASERGDYFQMLATIVLVHPENSVYKACPTQDCNKKVVDLQNGMYRCEKCGQEYPNFKYRLLTNVHLGDWTGSQWTTLFTAEAEKILGVSSDELGRALETNPEGAAAIFDAVNFKQYIVKCRAKMEMYNDESRLKTVVVRVDPVNDVDFNKHILERIEQLMAPSN